MTIMVSMIKTSTLLVTHEEFEQKKAAGDLFITSILAKPMLVAKGELPT